MQPQKKKTTKHANLCSRAHCARVLGRRELGCAEARKHTPSHGHTEARARAKLEADFAAQKEELARRQEEAERRLHEQ
eukprot:4191294-Pleurochrysis_carterae.AAC.3